ncbi:MAG: hypothetical protein V8R55_12745 [Dysosmobacter sp.]
MKLAGLENSADEARILFLYHAWCAFRKKEKQEQEKIISLAPCGLLLIEMENPTVVPTRIM